MLRVLGRILYLLLPFLITAAIVAGYRHTLPPAPDDPQVLRAFDAAALGPYTP